jgi:hypothetical protein
MAEIHVPRAHAAGGPGSNDENPTTKHEESDVNINAILAFAAGLVAVAIVVHLLIWVLFRFFDARESRAATVEYPLAVQQEQRLPPEPRLQTNPRQDLQDLRAGENDVLTRYGWIDKNGGVVRIPIDEAMRIVVERGLPARGKQ